MYDAIFADVISDYIPLYKTGETFYYYYKY